MKHNFMNKENGKIASVLVMYLDDDGHMQADSYDKVEDLMADYGAYEPAKPEPLIKDEKIRKAVRAWANLNMLKRVAVNPPTEDCSIISFTYGMLEIGFFLGRSDISGGTYTIAELCGEEEE